MPSTQLPLKRSWAGNPFFRIAHKWADGYNSLRLRFARRSRFLPATVPYFSYGSTTEVRILARVLLAPRPLAGKRALERQAANENLRGWRVFTSVPIPHRPVEIEIGGVTHRVQADRGGLVDVILDAELEPGLHEATIRASGTPAARVPITVLNPATPFGIISDIDDTVMVTALPRPFVAFWNAFVVNERARMATTGMAVLYERIQRAQPGAPIIYLSTGPWNAASTLTRFLYRNMYPQGPLLLTDWGLTEKHWFRSGMEHKSNNLELLARQFPERKWLLIGDNGQHDEKIYADFVARYPQNVAAVAIRQLSVGESVLAGGHSLEVDHSDSAIPWIYAPDGAGIAEQLKMIGLL